jgi:hypothetical protein
LGLNWNEYSCLGFRIPKISFCYGHKIASWQDHDYIGKQEEEIQLLKAKVISLEISGMKKDSIINEKKNDLELLKVDYEEVKEKLNTVEKEKDKK